MEDVKILVTLAQGAAEPVYATPGAAGCDLASNVELTILPGERALVGTGLSIALPVGYEAQIRPRSGLALKHGVTVLNSPGTIDADYRGDIGVILINHGDRAFAVEKGMRIAQMVIAKVERFSFVIAPSLDDTERGAGGFGSTGM